MAVVLKPFGALSLTLLLMNAPGSVEYEGTVKLLDSTAVGCWPEAAALPEPCCCVVAA